MNKVRSMKPTAILLLLLILIIGNSPHLLCTAFAPSQKLQISSRTTTFASRLRLLHLFRDTNTKSEKGIDSKKSYANKQRRKTPLQNKAQLTTQSTRKQQQQQPQPQSPTPHEDLVFGLPRNSVFHPLALLLASQLILFVGVGAVIPSIPLYGKEIGLSGAANGIVISAPAVALLLLANVSGKWADQARKPAMMWGMAMIVMSDLGTASATTLPALIVARLGLGAGRGISEAGERGLLADLAGRVPALRGRALAAQQAVIALGIAIGAPLGGLVVEQYGPRAAFLCVSAAASVTLLCYAFLPETVTNNSDAVDSNGATMKKTDNNRKDNNNSNADVVEWTTLLQDYQWRGLALCQSGASFGFAAKISSVPILAADTLPGGAMGAGALLSAAGLSGLIGAPLGGWITDQAGAKFAAVVSGIFSAVALMMIPLSLSPLAPTVLPQLQDLSLGEMGGTAIAFSSLVLMWSTAVAAQGPAMTAFAQELAPLGSEATSLALPRAAGDGTYIVAPFMLGLAADAFVGTPGVECAVAGSASLFGALALALFGKVTQTSSKKLK